MAPLVIGSYSIFAPRKMCCTGLAGGRSHRRYAAKACAAAGNKGSSIDTLVFGRRTRSTPACQSSSSNRIPRTSAVPRPYVANSNTIASSRLPALAFERSNAESFDCRSTAKCVVAAHLSDIVVRSPHWQGQPSTFWSIHRIGEAPGANCRYLQRFVWMVASSRTKASTFVKVSRPMVFLPRHNCPRKPPAVSRSRR
jgi:hypothetical protein